MRILHISDIQEGEFGIKPNLQERNPNNWQEEYQNILLDIKNIFENIHSKTPIDIIIISGDLASKGLKEEYELLSKEFIPILEEVFLKKSNPINKKFWLVVPGNHDLQFGKDQQRFNEFINFCEINGINHMYKNDNPNSIFSSILFKSDSDNAIEFILVNSCIDILDKQSRKKSNIPKEYFYKNLDKISKGIKLPKILICHHRLNEISSADNHALGELSDKNVLLTLTGDIHKSQKDVDTIFNIKCIPTGSLLAAKKEREAGIDIIPRQFNVYDINLKTGILNRITYYKAASWEEQERKIVDLPFGDKVSYKLISPFASFDEFFEPYIDETKLFNHLTPLIGRDNIINQLMDFIQSDKKIAILNGRGGIGKSKILFEFGKSFQKIQKGIELIFLRISVELNENSIRQLLGKKCVLIVDDAHQRRDLNILFQIAQILSDTIKIIIATRPIGISDIETLLNTFNFDLKDILKIPLLEELDQSKTKELALNALNENDTHIDLLIKLSDKNPLVIIIGGRLISKNLVDPKNLFQDKEFQWNVLNKFKDVQIGKVSKEINSDICQNLLFLISILSPLKINIYDFQKHISDYLKIDNSKLNIYIGILENDGIICRENNYIRIIPDVLSDQILYNACITSNKESSGYIEEIFHNFRSYYFSNILSNAAELNWQTKRNGMEIDLIGKTWSLIYEEFKNLSNFQRLKLLEGLRKFAYFQPIECLELIEFTINNPSQILSEADKQFKNIYEFSHKDVLKKIPVLLEEISYHIDHFPRCCNLLWQIGKDRDEFFLDPHESFNQTLLKLAEYNLHRPLKFNELILECVEKWLMESDAFDHKNSPLSFLSKLLTKKGEEVRLINKNRITITRFVLEYQKIKNVRQKAISILNSCIKSKITKEQLEAINLLISTLYPIRNDEGFTVSENESKNWYNEQIDILSVIENALPLITNSIVLNNLIYELQKLVNYPFNPMPRERIILIIKLISDSFDLRFANAISNINYQNWRVENDEEFDKKILEKTSNFIKEFINKINNNGNDAFKLIEQKLNEFKNYRIQANPNKFLRLIGDNYNNLSIKICNEVINNPSCQLSEYIHILLTSIYQKNIIEFLKLVKSCLKTNSEKLYLSIATGYVQEGWTVNIKKKEFKFIRKLLRYSNQSVKNQSIKILGRIPNYKLKIYKLMLKIEIGNNDILADSLCGEMFFGRKGFSEDFDNRFLKKILLKFNYIKSLNENLYSLKDFLVFCSSKIPDAVIDFFIERIERGVKYSNLDVEFNPFPYKGFNNKIGENLALSLNYENYLRSVREYILNQNEENLIYFSKLLIEVSNNFSKKFFDILEEWLVSEEVDKISALGSFLKKVPYNFVFKYSQFISRILEKAHQLNQGLYDIMCKKILQSTSPEIVIGDFNLLYEKIYEDAKKICQNCQEGTPTRKFYETIAKTAKRQITEELDLM